MTSRVVARVLQTIVAATVIAATPRTSIAQPNALAGHVSDSATRRAVSGALVETFRDGVPVARTTSDPTGRFALALLEAGTFDIIVRAIGYEPRRMTGVLFTARPADTTDISVLMSPLGTRLNPTVVSVSRREEKATDAPATVTVISTEQIEEQPATTPIEHARDAPGVDIASTGIIQSHIVTRGFNGVFSGALLVLTDHRYAFVPSLRVNAPWLIPTINADIDRIEIALGPASALYGPNATAGVLEIFTKSPFDAPGTTISAAAIGRGSNGVGSAGGVGQFALRHAGMVGTKIGYKVTAQVLDGSDWTEYDSAEVSARRDAIGHGADPRTSLIGNRNFGVRRWSLEGRADYAPREGTTVTLSSGRTQVGSAIELTGIGAVQVRDWRYDYYQAQVTHGGWFAQAFANVNGAGGTYLLRTGQPIIDHSQMLVGQLQHETDLGARHTLVYGVDAQQTEPRTGGTVTGRNEGNDGIDEIGGYVQSESHLTPKVELITAARVDRNNRLPSPVFSPRAALVFKPSDSHTFRLAYNQAFETPTTNDLFLDIVAATLSPAPFNVRALGVPAGGFTFRRDCGGPTGLCMRTPFGGSPGQALPVDATLIWTGLVNALNAAGLADLRGVPAPTSADVRSELRRLNFSDTQHPTFDAVTASDVRDVQALRETRVTTLEAGYKAILGEHLRLAADVYYERRNNFIGPAAVETPNVFLRAGQVGESGTLANYLARFLPTDRAQQIATLIGGVAGSPSATGFPLGTVAPENPLSASPDVVLTFRNFGTLHRWGSDVAAQWLPVEEWTVTGAFSWTNKDLFTRAELGGVSDIALNSPRRRFSLGAQHRDNDRGLTLWTRARFNDAFPMNSGVYVGSVESAAVVDAGLAYRMFGRKDLVLTLAAQNVTDERHREFVGGPVLGRVVTAQAEYTLPR